MTTTRNHPNPAATYQRDEVLTASPLRLVCRVFGGAMAALQRARRFAQDGNHRGYRKEIYRARGLVSELLGALDKDRGGDIARQLEALYEFILTQLLNRTATQDLGALSHAEEILGKLKEGFDAILESGAGLADVV